MKYRYMTRLFVAGALMAAFAFAGCSKDDDRIDLPTNPDSQQMNLSSLADFYEITLPGNKGWAVESAPEWTTPADSAGAAGTKLSLFVGDNVTETSRTDTLKVRLDDRTQYQVVLSQRSPLTEDENDIVQDKKLKISTGVGYGVNVLLPANDGKYNLSYGIIDPVKLINALDALGERDAYSEENQYFSRTDSYVGTSTNSISTQLSVNAGIDVEIAGFKVAVEGAYSSNESSNTKTGYAMRSIKHITGMRYLRSGILRYLVENGNDIFQNDFHYYLDPVLKNPTKSNIAALVEAYGTHIVTTGTVGGELQFTLEMQNTSTVKESDLHAALDLTVKVVGISGGVDMSDSEKNMANNMKVSLQTYGGDNAFTLTPGHAFEELMVETFSKDKLDAWARNIQNGGTAVLIDMQTMPIYDLITDPAVREAVRDYIVNDYQVQINKQGPQMYAVTGFNEGVAGSLYIPEIDVKLEFYNEMIPEISTTNNSTVVYSGTETEMNYETGFFIGSADKQPGKLRKLRDGSYTYEPFTILSSGEVTELYVDATGEVTIAPKTTDADLYMERKFNVIPEDYRDDWITNITHVGEEEERGPISLSIGDWEAIDLDRFFNLRTTKYWYYVREKRSIGCVSKNLTSLRDHIDTGNLEATFGFRYEYPLMSASIEKVIFEFYSERSANALIDTKEYEVPFYSGSLNCKFNIPKETRYVFVYLLVRERTYNDVIDLMQDFRVSITRLKLYAPFSINFPYANNKR